MVDLSLSAAFSFLITIKASPSIHTSLKPRSSANVTTCRHAHASTMDASKFALTDSPSGGSQITFTASCTNL
ncbi:hypothetical protein Golob_013051, partial [Gossypium lobatum]|nr:hypothetical protein [Gossypium lobatum]